MSQLLKRTDIGLGLRIAHYSEIFSQWPEVDFFEIISENFMVEGGLPLVNLDRALERYKIVQHGVSLNIASQDPLNWDYLKRLKQLTQRTKTPFVTDHLCWTGSHGHNLHDLLPFPYTEALVKYIAEKARIVQDYLELPFGLENLSSYVSFSNSEMSEWEFYHQVIERSGCYYMCDINNIYVSSINHQFDPKDYIQGLDWDRVLQCHIAGHSELANGTILDTHDHPVRDEVWDLYNVAWQHSGGFPTLLEWDDNFISFNETHKQALRALEVPARRGEQSDSSAPTTPYYPSPQFQHSPEEVLDQQAEVPEHLSDFQADFRSTMALPFLFQDASKQSFQYDKSSFRENIVKLMVDREDLAGIDRLCTYNQQYWFRLLSLMQSLYPTLVNQLGYFEFNQLITLYLTKYPSRYPSLDHIDDQFPQFMREEHTWSLTLFQEMADLDYIFSKNFTAEQKSVFNAQALSQEEVAQLAQTRLPFQPSFALFQSSWDLRQYRKDILALEDIEDTQTPQPKNQYLAIYRASNQFKVEDLHPIAFQLLEGLYQGHSLAQVIDTLSENLDSEQLEYLGEHIQGWFQKWTQQGWFAQ